MINFNIAEKKLMMVMMLTIFHWQATSKETGMWIIWRLATQQRKNDHRGSHRPSQFVSLTQTG